MQLQQNNLIYVRAKNNFNGAETGTIALFYVPCGVINWPSQWVNNNLKTAGGNNTVALTAAQTGIVAVGNDVFQWIPGPPPSGSSHYCLIAQVVTPNNPNPIPGATGMTYEDMATIVASDLGFGWLNVALISQGSTPTWNYQTMLTVPQSVGQTQQVHLYVACNNVTTGCAVGFSCSSTDANGQPITLPKTPVTASDGIYGVTVPLQPGFSGSVTVSYWSNSENQPSGATFDLEAAYESPTASPNAPYYNAAFINKLHTNAVGITPTTPVYLGNMRYQYQYQ